MTETEGKIIERDEQRQEMLASELSSRASFIAAIASLGAFIVLQWVASSHHPSIAILLLVSVVLCFGLLFCQAFGLKYFYPAIPSCWIQWRTDRIGTLREFGLPEREASGQAEDELMQAFWIAAQVRAERNRKTSKVKSCLLGASGSIAIVLIVSVVLLWALTLAGLF